MNKTILDREVTLHVAGEELVFDPNKVLYWPKTRILFLSDAHFGKVSHFRKGGIAIPQNLAIINYQRLDQVIEKYNPVKVVVLGDLFHSDHNTEWDLLKDFVESYADVEFDLVLGNHDILSHNEWYESKFNVFYDHLDLAPFVLSHFPIEKPHKSLFNLAGHIHPGVRLSGGPGQGRRFPCFYINQFQLILPAFGDFTGNYKLKPKKGDRVVVVAENKLVLFE